LRRRYEELELALSEQVEALDLTRRAVASVEAPETLRARLRDQERTHGRQPSRRFVLIPAAALVAAAAAALVVALTSGGSAARFRAALAATTLAPAARGEATFTKRPAGWQVQLDVRGLPHLAGGAFYEAWLRDAAGTLVPVGTFDDGRRVTLWAGVAPTQFTKLTVTRERADGNQGSSGEQVLVGTVGRGGS
jgi:hypothetical protein